VGSLLLKPAHLTSDEDWSLTVAQNLNAAFYVLRGGIKAAGSRAVSFVFFSSVAARVGLPNHEAIAAVKAGIEGLVRSAAATYCGRGVRVNAVAPGLVATPLTVRITGNEASRAASEAMHPLGRIGTPEDISAATVWLLGEEASWVTGQVISVDGGMSTVKAPPRKV
jgi:NAD(P)-dependent dehydrogenase (short-subunit alcohol dehydrogenase family)